MPHARRINFKHFDWLTFGLYLVLVATGLALIYSVDTAHGSGGRFFYKQLAWAALSLAAFVAVWYADVKKIRQWSSLIYLGGLLLLAGLFVAGKEVSGARSWYRIGGFGFQPAEFMKLATALGLAKLLSERQFDLRQKGAVWKALLLVGIPAFLILLQPDLGSVLIFGAFLLVLYREGLNGWYLFLIAWVAFLFLLTVKFGSTLILLWLGATWLLSALVIARQIKRHRRYFIYLLSLFMGASMLFVAASHYGYTRVLKPHQQKRIALLLGLIRDEKGVGYHLKQSLIAVSNGGLKGQGFLQGVQLRGNYIPEQHTDYIFTALAEQAGFAGAVAFLIVYLLFIVRLFMLAERQKQPFSRIVGYSLAALLLFHLLINVMMVLGLFPVVGIPIIFVSYGGSSLFIFSLFLFLFLKMDAQEKFIF
ncbi:MAG: FtsW/RodA/SpoVE family cell cycle protein [Chlorobi bacterium]|nr:FtsW/RodA/SpoVE family cell cycle protein [Chlorobiota bacterium]